MYCQQCNQRPATVYITKIINGEKSEMHLCQECATKMQETSGFGWDPHFSMNLLSSFFEEAEAALNLAQNFPKMDRCETCGLTYSSFRQSGKLGCSDCYNTFMAQLSPVIRQIHGSEKHTGKIPERGGEQLHIKKKIEQLKDKMQELVQREEFEKAAEVRDEIRRLEGKLK